MAPPGTALVGPAQDVIGGDGRENGGNEKHRQMHGADHGVRIILSLRTHGPHMGTDCGATMMISVA